MTSKVITNPDIFRDWMVTLRDVWAFDTEGVSLNWLDLEMVGFSISDGIQGCYVDLTEENKTRMLSILDYYITQARIIIMHNSPYDMMCLRKEGIEI